MATTSIGSGIESLEIDIAPDPIPMPVGEEPAISPVQMPTIDLESIKAQVRAEIRHEMDAAVADVERRLAQARQIERAVESGVPREIFHAEDLNIRKHLVDGYTMTANSPTAGYIAWASLHVVLMGVDYTIANGNTNLKYAWFIKPGSGTGPVTLGTGNTLPVLGPNDAVIFVNNGGVPISALESSISYAVGPGVIGDAQLAYEVKSVLDTLSASDIAQQSALDGAITTYYQNDPPWPNGSPSPEGGNINMGDVWYDANDNGAYRWTGATPGGGLTANTWFKIADTDNSALASQLNTKTTTWLRNDASPPPAPTGGHTIGDLWMVLDKNNLLRRWNGTIWQDLQLGDLALAGISGNKVGTGINASNITTGILGGNLVGSGINAGNITGGTLGPGRLNTAFHMLY